MELKNVLIIFVVMVECTAEISFNEFLAIPADDAFVYTGCKRIYGKRRLGHLDGDGLYDKVEWFLGIPYALPPKRFEKPKPPICDDDTIFATNFSYSCEQEPLIPVEIGEDCLNLNIYRPAEDSMELMPVMVYIHGGSYAVGTGSIFLGDQLAQHGVVVVTINYRLTLFGFLSAGHSSLGGNYGMHDQIEALRWVKENIKHFGGDPTRVTIFGNSAGGSSVGLLTLTPKAKGLFSQVIVQSGSPLAFWAFNEFSKSDMNKYVRQLASHANCVQDRMEDLVDCLKHVSRNDLIYALGDMMILSPVKTDFTPALDNEVFNQYPVETKEFQFNGPMMAGDVTREFDNHFYAWLSFYNTLIKYGNKDFVDLDYLYKDLTQEEFRKITDFLFTNYFTNYTRKDVDSIYEHYGFHDGVSQTRYNDLLTDIFMIIPTLKFADLYQRITRQPTYFYEFNHNSSFTYPRNFHEIELSYIFGYIYNDLLHGKIVRLSNKNETDVSRFMMKLWTNFAKYGNPNEDVIFGSKYKWDPLSKNFNCFIINDEDSSVLRKQYKINDMVFWDRMPRLKVQFRINSNASFKVVTSNIALITLKLFLFLIIGQEL